jgi:hypothetical protein
VPCVTSIAPFPTVPDPDGPHHEAVLPPETLETIACGLAAGLPASARDASGLSGRRWQRLVATTEYDAWLIQWGPDTHVEPHDHGGSAGALAVAAGELQDVVLTPDGPLRTTVTAGGSRIVPADVVHDVVCPRGGAVSVHVYSPPLEWMTMYSEDLRPERLAQVDHEPPAWPAERVDPTSR